MAETLEANMRKVIIQEMPINPVYYEKMSILLLELIRQRKLGAISYKEFLKQFEELAKKLQPIKSKDYPSSVDNNAKRAFYDKLDKNESLANRLFTEINNKRPDNWIGNPIKTKAVRIIIVQVLQEQDISDEILVKELLELASNQEEFK